MRYFLKFKTQGLDSRRHLLDFFLMATLACDFFPAFLNCAGIIMEITRPPSPQKNNGSCLRIIVQQLLIIFLVSFQSKNCKYQRPVFLENVETL